LQRGFQSHISSELSPLAPASERSAQRAFPFKKLQRTPEQTLHASIVASGASAGHQSLGSSYVGRPRFLSHGSIHSGKIEAMIARPGLSFNMQDAMGNFGVRSVLPICCRQAAIAVVVHT